MNPGDYALFWVGSYHYPLDLGLIFRQTYSFLLFEWFVTTCRTEKDSHDGLWFLFFRIFNLHKPCVFKLFHVAPKIFSRIFVGQMSMDLLRGQPASAEEWGQDPTTSTKVRGTGEVGEGAHFAVLGWCGMKQSMVDSGWNLLIDSLGLLLANLLKITQPIVFWGLWTHP